MKRWLTMIAKITSSAWRQDTEAGLLLRYLAFSFLTVVFVMALGVFYDLSFSDFDPENLGLLPPLALVYLFMFFIFLDTIFSIGSSSSNATLAEISYLFFFMCATIMIFGKIYEVYGLKYIAEPDVALIKFDYFYFSIVTWTTLGYGDIITVNESKPIAMLQVCIGFAMNTVTFGAILSRLTSRPLVQANNEEA